MAVASLVLGIVSLVFSVIGMGWMGAIIGIVGIILCVQGKKDPEKAGMAKAGFVCSVIGVILGLAFYIACAGCIGSLGGLAALA